MTSPTFGPSGPPQYETSYDQFKPGPSKIQKTSTIVDMYLPVMDEDPASIHKAARGWTTLARHLDTYRSHLAGEYAKLAPKWTSKAAKPYGSWVGNTTWSLHDWHDAAQANAAALHTLATTMTGLQKRMQEIWDEFDQKSAAAEKEEKSSAWMSWTKLYDDITSRNPFDSVLQTYTEKARTEVVEPLNKAYYEAFVATYPGARFVGPVNAQKPTKEQLLEAMGLPNGIPPGSGTPPAVPGGPPSTPPPIPAVPPLTPPETAMPTPPETAMPSMPSMPTAPVAPVVPIAPIAPTLPTGPTAPTRPSRLASPPVPVALPPEPTGPAGPASPPVPLSGREAAPEAPAADPPGARPAPGARPNAPGLPRGLGGRGLSGEPERPPGMRTPPSQLSGRRRGSPPRPPGSRMPPGEEAEPPPGRGGPALPGRNGTRRPAKTGDDDVPPSRLGARPGLRGIRDTTPRLRPGSVEAEELPLRQLRALSGRFAAAGESAKQAPRPELAGRGRAERTERPPEPAHTPDVDFVGDSELFAAEQRAPAVIEPPAQARPIAERPALRPPQTQIGG